MENQEGNQGVTQTDIPSTTTDIDVRSIISRMEAPKPQAQEVNPPEVPKLDDIKDPNARSLVEKRLKELESGFNKKYEELAHKRKEYESKLNESDVWNRDKLDRALKDPTFISLVQAHYQQASTHRPPATWEGSTEEWSALTTEEKQQFAQLNSRVAAQEQMMSQMLKAEEDTKLKTVYPDYDPKTVDQIQQDLLSGRVQATREHLWKVANFENAVKRAYELGIQDRKLEINDKLNASTPQSVRTITPSGEVPEEIKKGGFASIAKWRLQQARGSK